MNRCEMGDHMGRRAFFHLRHTLVFSLLLLCISLNAFAAEKPNIIIIIADDMGWRDTGYGGDPYIKTPALDEMAAKGIRFNYFYAAGQKCCPGRYAILTGRSPVRGGILGNDPILPRETTLARALKNAGYQSAYFGKWHLGKGPTTNPIAMGYDQAIWKQTQFDLDPSFMVNNSKEFIQKKGDGSVALMELVDNYIEKQVKSHQPFFVTVGFAAPHDPHFAAPEFGALYKNLPHEQAQFFGEISGLDAAVGALRQNLRRLGAAENTLVWFMSDNGAPRNDRLDPSKRGKGQIGARTVALLEWPGHIQQPRIVNMPCGHVDVYPTILDITGTRVTDQPIIDGISLLPLLDNKMSVRPKPLGFMLFEYPREKVPTLDFVTDTQRIWIDGEYELNLEDSRYKGATPVRLFDIFKDPAHKNNLAAQLPDVVRRMRNALEEWQRSVRSSYDGKDIVTKK